MILSINSENAYERVQHPCMIEEEKTFHKLEIERHFIK